MLKYPSIEALDKVRPFMQGMDVLVQEKLDGSNVAIVCYDGAITLQSRNQELTETSQGFHRFQAWVDSVRPILESDYFDGLVLYGEMLNTNKLRYETASPFVLFDIFEATPSRDEENRRVNVHEFLNSSYNKVEMYQATLNEAANMLSCDVAPTIYRGDFDYFEGYEGPSLFDPNLQAEGYVVKTFDATITWTDTESGEPRSTLAPFLMGKHVREEFKEVKQKVVERENPLDTLSEMFVTAPRVTKAIARCKEVGLDAANFGNVIRFALEDIESEEGDTVRKELYKRFERDLRKTFSAAIVQHLKATPYAET